MLASQGTGLASAHPGVLYMSGALLADGLLSTEQNRLERFERANICVLEYARQKAEVGKTSITTAIGLEEYLSRDHDDPSVGLRLFVVEDLSRGVIEALGSTFDIDPSFFREHIVDYVWYNVSKSVLVVVFMDPERWLQSRHELLTLAMQRIGGETPQTWISSRKVKTGCRCGT